MISLFVNSEGGLTTAGYVLSIGVMVVCVLAGLALSDRTEKNRTFSARRLAYCAMAVALAYVTSFIKPFELPYGGSVTLLSMLFIVLVGNWYGVKSRCAGGLAYVCCSFCRSRISSVCSRCAATMCWHLRHWGFPACSGNGRTVF